MLLATVAIVFVALILLSMPIAAPISVSHASDSSPTSSTQVNGTGSTSSQSVMAPTK